jgi:hypothetical protein
MELIENVPESEYSTKYKDEIYEIFLKIWDDKAYKEAFLSKEKIQMFDGAEYFLNKIKDLKPSFVPENQDIIYTRRKSIGIKEISFKRDGQRYKLYDVGGKQKSKTRTKKREKKVGELDKLGLYNIFSVVE